jgi:hypothetical protein
MKRFSLVVFAAAFVFSWSAYAQRATPCPEVDSIADCPDEGCSGDSELNRRKNVRADDQAPKLKTIEEMKELPNPDTRRFRSDNRDRSVLNEMGEGEKITVVAWALTARPGGKESCNCKLGGQQDTDNHIVLVDPALKRPTLTKKTEDHSVTAEFTPRVKPDHQGFKRAKLNRLIDPDWDGGSGNPDGKLLVRVTGLLLFDSEHYFGNALHRENDWEIHPVLKLEYCPDGATCRGDNDENWVDLDSE